MADVDWNKIKAEYVTTKISQQKLAAKYGVPYITIRRRAEKEKWIELRANSEQRVSEKAIAKAEKQKVDYKSVLYDLAYSMAQKLTDFSTKYTLDEMVALGIKPRDITGAIKDLEDSLHIKSEADLREQEARIDKLRREAEANNDNTDNSIKVVISSELEDYAQ